MKQIPNKQTTKQYDLEDRTFDFAKKTRLFIKELPKSIVNVEDCKQLLRSSASIGANYIEANDSLSKKDFIMRIKICKKEAKESIYWLKLLDMNLDNESEKVRASLAQEGKELMNIFGAILQKTSN